MSEMNPYQPPVLVENATGGFNANGRLLDAGQGWRWIASAFALFMKWPLMWVLLFIVYFVCNVALSMIPLLGGIATMLLFPVFGAGFCKDIADVIVDGSLADREFFSDFLIR
jgi:hypothetical protein